MRSLRIAALIALCVLAFAFVPPAAYAAPPLGSPETYLVQPGDTLYAIAIRYRTTIVAIKKLNGLTGDTIQVGQKLLVPGDDSPASAAAPISSYIVQPGDTLYRIALRYGTTMRALSDLNGIPNPNLISVGQALAIPNSVTLAKPGLTIDPQFVRQGGTLLVQVARPDLVSVSGAFNGQQLTFTRSAGYFYALVGISRCSKLGAIPLNLTAADLNGQSSTDSATVTVQATAFTVEKLTLAPSVSAVLNDQTLVKREAEQLAAMVSPRTPSRMWNGPFRQPLVGRISSNFGERRSYNGGPVGPCGHEGTDFAVPGGTPIYADARGRVVFAGSTQVRGNLVVVDHGLGVYSGYYHQSEINVKVGQMVDAGDLIGKVGTTGLSTGNHLHWSMFVNGEYVDPMEWTRRMLP